ncbi:hypothetical protein D3C75_838960 [compost metagenome]
MPVTGTTAALTVTVLSAYLEGSASLVTRITAVPGFIAVTSPVDDTAATLPALWLTIVQFTFLLPAFSGNTVAISCSVCPAFRLKDALFKWTADTGTSAAATVTIHFTYLAGSA